MSGQNSGTRSVTVAVIGAGLGGVAVAVNLRKRGIRSFTVFEKSDGPGGTWWDNRYPGAECDVPSSLYSYSFKLHDWTRTHAPQAEIQQYMEDVLDEFGIRPMFRFGTGVVSANWSDDRQQYNVTLDTGESAWFDVVVSAVGMLNVPKIPDWPGMDTFEGPLFHSARWDQSAELDGKRVAVVGGGASAAQVVPGLQPRVGALLNFQREPGWVIPKGDRDYSAEERTELNRFGRRRRERWKVLRMFDKGVVSGATPEGNAAMRARAEAFIATSFPDDPELRALLTPSFQPRCKRNVLSNTLYPALQQPNVTFVPQAVERVTPTGVVDSSGAEHAVDAIVLTTGFQAANFLSTLDVTGRGGESLHDTWGDDPQAFLGMTVPSFPNFYILYGPNTHGTVVAYVLERQAEFVARDVKKLTRAGGGTVELRREANEWFQRTLQQGIDGVESWKSGCHNFYLSPSGRNVVQWPWTHARYHLMAMALRRWSSTFRATPASAILARTSTPALLTTSKENS